MKSAPTETPIIPPIRLICAIKVTFYAKLQIRGEKTSLGCKKRNADMSDWIRLDVLLHDSGVKKDVHSCILS